jgi:hypothetical protein
VQKLENNLNLVRYCRTDFLANSKSNSNVDYRSYEFYDIQRILSATRRGLGMKSKLVSFDTLQRMHEGQNTETPCMIKTVCSECQREAEIELYKTSGGFGLQRGVFYEIDGKILAMCLDCYLKSE